MRERKTLLMCKANSTSQIFCKLKKTTNPKYTQLHYIYVCMNMVYRGNEGTEREENECDSISSIRAYISYKESKIYI